MGSKKKAKKAKRAKRKPKAAPAGLKLEYGKRYIRRDGLVTDPLEESHLPAAWPFLDPKYSWTYTPEGFNKTPEAETKHDLVEEYKQDYQALDKLVKDVLTAEQCPPEQLVVCSDSPTKEVMEAVLKELEGARKAFPPMASLHEAFSILLEEVDELKAEVQKKQLVRDKADKHNSQCIEVYKPNLMRTTEAKKEAIQVAAMAMRLIIDCCLQTGDSYGK